MKPQEIPIKPFIENERIFAIRINGRYWDVCRSQDNNIDWKMVEDFSEKFMDYANIHDFKRIIEHLEKRSQKREEIVTEEDQQIIARLHNRISIFEVPDKIFEQKYITLRNEKGNVEEYVPVLIWDTDKINWENIAHAVKYYRSINKKVAIKRMLNKLNKEIIHMEFSELETKIESVIQEIKPVEQIQEQIQEQTKEMDQMNSEAEPNQKLENMIALEQELELAKTNLQQYNNTTMIFQETMNYLNHKLNELGNLIKTLKEIIQSAIAVPIPEVDQEYRPIEVHEPISEMITIPDGLPKELIIDTIDLRREQLEHTIQK